MLRYIMMQAIQVSLKRIFTVESDEIMATDRKMPERRAARGRDEAVSKALSGAKLMREVLTSIPMLAQAEACELLGLSVSNSSAELGQLEKKGEILRFDWMETASYPLFQFDVDGRRVHPALIKLIEMRTEEWGGNLALLYWLTRPNRSLGGAKPCDRLNVDEDRILRSFAAEISSPLIG